MKKELVCIIPGIISVVINILCIFGKADITVVKWGASAVTVSCFIYMLLGDLARYRRKKRNLSVIYQREKSTPIKTVYEVLSISVTLGYIITLLFAFMFYYNKWAI